MKRPKQIMLTSDGMAVYRTVLMPKDAALRFARMVDKNPRFTGAEVMESRRATGEDRWYVLYLPVKEPQRLREALLARTEQRAANRQCEFWQDPDSPSLVWCLSHHGDQENVHELSVRGRIAIDCNCESREYRYRRANLPCVHMVIWNGLRMELVK